MKKNSKIEVNRDLNELAHGMEQACVEFGTPMGTLLCSRTTAENIGTEYSNKIYDEIKQIYSDIEDAVDKLQELTTETFLKAAGDDDE